MRLNLIHLCTLFLVLLFQWSFSQEKTVSGTITSGKDGLPLPGVNVLLKGTLKGTQTDFKPFLDLVLLTPSGYYLKDTGPIAFSSRTYTMINIDDPSIYINYTDCCN